MPNVTELHVNGARVQLDADPERRLLSVLRDDLGLTGSKFGCGEGQCGACTVMIGGNPARSCLVPVGAVREQPVVTVEGLARDGELHPVQAAFLEVGAYQCAYCTSGMIMSGVSLLQRNPEADETEIRRALQGNVCRCGVYPRILEAMTRAVRALKEAGE